MRGILLRSRVGSVLIEPRKSPEKIAGSDKDLDTDVFADLDKEERTKHRGTGLHGCSQHVPKLQYSPLFSIRVK